MTAGQEAQRELTQRRAAKARSPRAAGAVNACLYALETETDPQRRAVLEDWVVEVQAIIDGGGELAVAGATKIHDFIGRERVTR